MKSARFRRLAFGALTSALLVGCGDDATLQTSISGGATDSVGTTAGGSSAMTMTGADTGTTGGNGEGSATDGGSTGADTTDGADTGTDTTGGPGGDSCAVTQQGLCENPGERVLCYSGAPDTCEVGACVGGVQTCEGFDLDLGMWTECSAEVLPALESCDGIDNDCDGAIDEELGQTQCGLGVCAHSEDNCVSGELVQCDPFEGASDEVCDGDDNDCDGDIDEGLDGDFIMCGQGQCEHSVSACIDGMVPTCDPFEGATAEACDAIDNDCDGDIDEDLGTDTCGLGQCLHTIDTCSNGQLQICDPFEGATAEVCDAIDNDCDGSVDEGFSDVTCGLGVCEHTIEQCVNGQLQICDPMLGASPEMCDDGLDNDCDGMVDEDCVCGNDMINGTEQCDGADLGGQTCVGLGHDGGTLACSPICTFDTSGCYDCGDGSADPGEQCDGNDLAGQTCSGLGHDGGTLGCSATCTYDTSGCYDCGDGSIDPGEQCDGNALGGQTCSGLGYDGGALGCSATCTYDTSACYDCGDGNVNPGEQCDGNDLAGQTCMGLGFDGGLLACTPTCTYDPSGCYDCGDGNINPGEQCDGNNLGGQTCSTLGHDGGTLTCSATCGFDTSGCYDCGDGNIDPGEQCDGNALGGQTCGGLGYDGGALACSPTCTYDTSACYECGDGNVDPGEQCDGNDLNGATCGGLGFDGGALACSATCTYDTSGCYECGDGNVDPGEQCDGNDLNGATCQSLGWDGGTLVCTAQCDYDTSGCTAVCDAPDQHLVCDDDDDPFHAIGLNCPGNANNSTPISGESFVSPDTTAYRVAAQFGSSGYWTPREGNSFLIISTGVLPAPNGNDEVIVPVDDGQIGTGNANPGQYGMGAFDQPVALPAPIFPIDGSNFGAGGTPYVNCDGINDCSDTLEAAWQFGGAGAYDLLFFQFDVTVPAGTFGYAFDFAWFDAEYPEWIGSSFLDVLVVWSTSESFTGNIMVVDGEAFSSNSAAPHVTHPPGDPDLANTGFDNVGGGVDWYTATASATPGETLTLSWALFDMGDHFYDATVLLDNWRWDCPGCTPGTDCGLSPSP